MGRKEEASLSAYMRGSSEGTHGEFRGYCCPATSVVGAESIGISCLKELQKVKTESSNGEKTEAFRFVFFLIRRLRLITFCSSLRQDIPIDSAPTFEVAGQH